VTTADLAAIVEGVNALWVLVASFLVFFMQAGFALLEAGQVRAKNVANVLMKNLMDWSLGVLVYFAAGLAVARLVADLTSPAPLAVGEAFSYVGDPGAWIPWLFGAVFAMTAATIVSGAVASRMRFSAYVLVAVGVTTIVYPTVQGLTWAGGLLSAQGYLGAALGAGYQDFAGATVVHMVGGVAGLVGAYMLGPRRGRFDKDGESVPIPGHSMTFVVVGTLFLAFGWYGFNVGTQTAILSLESGAVAFSGDVLGRIALNTTLGMGAGGVAAAVVSARGTGTPDPLFTANGLLGGLVAVTGAVPHIAWWGAVPLGALAGAQVPVVYRWTVERLKVDDVCGVFAVHGSAGALGTWLIPFLAVGGFTWAQFAAQTAGVLLIAAWAAAATAGLFAVADRVFGLRVDEAEESAGLDRSEHGVAAYPEFGGEPEPAGADHDREVGA
jgi:Amt family ammonium transporter